MAPVHNIVKDILSNINFDTIFKALPGVLGVLASLLSPQVRHVLSTVFSPVIRMFSWLSFPFRLPGILIEQNNKILKELYPNSGSSLRDAINRLEKNQTLVNDRILNIMNHDKTPVFETDSDGLLTWTNIAFMVMTGRTMHELQGYGWINAIYEFDREKVSQQWDSAVEDRRSFEMIFSYQNTDGTVYPAFIRAAPVRSSGELVGWTGYVNLIDLDPPEPGKPTDAIEYARQQAAKKSGKDLHMAIDTQSTLFPGKQIDSDTTIWQNLE